MKQGLKVSLLGAAAAIALGSWAGSANADPITFTWSPSAAGVAGASNITANNMNVSDFAVASILANGNFTESGFLPVTTFLQGSSTVTPADYNNHTYQLYYSFSASGNIAGWDPTKPLGAYIGTISALTYNLEIDTTDNTTFHVAAGGATVANTADDKLLANGSLIPGTGSVTLVNGVPGANADATITADLAAFFLAPPPTTFVNLALESSFTNTRSVSTLIPGNPTILEINGGGGNADLTPIPEPATLSLFGAALIGLGFASRRRRKS